MIYQNHAVLLASTADKAPAPEWQIIMLFYAALHATNAALYGNGIAPETHKRHEFNLGAHDALQVFAADYEQLKQLSCDARYRPNLHPMTERQLRLARRLCRVIFTACNVPVPPSLDPPAPLMPPALSP